MKINRFFALAVIAAVVVSVMGVLSYRAFARTNTAPAAQDCAAEAEDEGAGEIEDADGVEDECGDQNGGETEDGDADAAAPTGVLVSADQARAIAEAANPGAAARGVEFEREGGGEYWEVELDNGLEVMVDAATGEILK